jgi:hypothetical protein
MSENIISYGIKDIPDDEIEKAIVSEYKDEEHQGYARQVGKIAGQFSNKPMIVGWNDTSKKRHYRRACKRFLMEEAKKEVKPVGIIPGFIFMAILSGIVSFFTQFLLKKYFESSDNSVDDEE